MAHNKHREKPLMMKFTLTMLLLILTTTSDPKSFATPMDYNVTGDLTGTINMDFMLNDGDSPAAFSWNLFHAGTGLVWNDGTDNVITNSRRIGLIGPIFSDAIILEVTDPFGNKLASIFYGQDQNPATGLDPLSYQASISLAMIPIAINPQGQFAPVPEPTTMLLTATGLLGLAGYRWQQRRREGTQVG